MRIVDQALPADGRARLLEINAHDDFQAVGQFVAQRVQAAGVFQRAAFVVDRARADDHQQARVCLPQDADDAFAAVRDGGAGFRHGRKQILHRARRREPDDFADMQILRLEHRRQYSGGQRGQKI